MQRLDALEGKFKAYLTTKPKRILRSDGPSPAERYVAIKEKYDARHSEDLMFGRDSGTTVMLSDILRLKNERPNDKEAQKLYNDVEKVYDAYTVDCYQLIENTNGQFANTSRDAKCTAKITTTSGLTKTQYGDRTVIKTKDCKADGISNMMRTM